MGHEWHDNYYSIHGDWNYKCKLSLALRFRLGDVVTTGAGVVFEDYDRQIDACGRIQLAHHGSSDDLYVKAGGVRLEWSSSNHTHSWLYYYPLREKVEVLDLSSFDSDFK